MSGLFTAGTRDGVSKEGLLMPLEGKAWPAYLYPKREASGRECRRQ